MKWAFCLLCVVTGCYSPHVTEGLNCSETFHCPTGEQCDLETNTCVATLPTPFVLDAISAGADHTCGIDKDGALYCWGHNDYGQLGLGDADDRNTPTRVGTATDWGVISAGERATCGLRTGSLWCWGDARVLGTASNQPTQVTVPDKSWQAVSVGLGGFCAVSTDKTVWCRWYDDAALTQSADAPPNAELITASDQRECVIDTQHQLYCWGNNTSAQVGGVPATTMTAPLTHHDGQWDSVVGSAWHTCAVKTNGDLYCWGSCDANQASDLPPDAPGTGYCMNPTRVTMDGYNLVAAGGLHTCGINLAHQIVCFGQNETGDLGSPTIELMASPSTIAGSQDWGSVTAGGEHSCGLTADGTAWCWGSDRYGQLGLEEVSFRETPAKLGFTQPVVDVSAGDTSTCAITADHVLWCWGNNGAGQLGDSTRGSPDPYPVDTELKDWQSVSTGTNHTCAIRSTGLLYCWGSNRQGQLGLGNTSDVTEHAPRQVGNFTDWTSVVAGTQETCATRPNELYCWGDLGKAISPRLVATGSWISLSMHAIPDLFQNGAHALSFDDGSEYDILDLRSAPVLDRHGIPSGMNQTGLAWGADHACSTVAGGGMYCWGHNDDGQMGVPQETTDYQNIPMSPDPAGPNGAWESFDAGGYATCAISEVAEELYCWGTNTLLGSPTVDARNPTPTVIQPGTKWSKVSVGHRHACAIQKADGSLWCWGENLDGELGLGYQGSDRPRRVHPPR